MVYINPPPFLLTLSIWHFRARNDIKSMIRLGSRGKGKDIEPCGYSPQGVEVSFSEHVVIVHCNSPRRKKTVETKVIEYHETNNFS